MLSPYRVLDLTNERGSLCGRILSDLGAEVIKIEKPGGDSCRNIGPFYQNIPDPEKSLYWFFCNLGKKSLTLNIETGDGQEILKKLVKISDFLIESFDPTYLDSLGLGYSVLSKINQRIIVTSITPFGQAGPYRDYKASDITLMAMGGLMYITGEPDRPPVRISVPQAYFIASAQATAATLTAHYYQGLTGEGQYVDVSIQECVLSTLANAIPAWELAQISLQRVGSFLSGRGAAGTKQRLIYPCKDGSVLYIVLGGRIGAPSNRAVVQWMDEEGMADDFIKSWEWEKYDFAIATPEMQERLEKYFARFFLIHTKEEIYNEGLKRGFMVAPVSSPRDIIENPQLQARDFWLQVEHPELNCKLTYPGTFYKSSEVTFKVPRRAPLIGEHNVEIYEKELCISKEEMATLKQAGVI